MEDAVNPAAGAANGKVPPASVYGGGPGQGITLPAYFKPTPSVVSASNFFPMLEELGPDEMRISFVGTCPFPPKRDQAATCIMVELGNGSRLFFDFGPGCLRNIAAFQVPVQDVNDIFITHLHVDHYGELPYLYAFAPWAARWKPLRVHGPSGHRPDEGIAEMIDGMKKMTHWHTKAFACGPVGEGYEVEVNEFDYEDDNGICYDKDGVTVRHWRRSHNMDGASAYRLDWNGLSFVWTGDGRPDTLTAKYAQGADVFVTELQPDLGRLMEMKTGVPQQIYNATIDLVHTDHYATGYVINQVQPRLGMVTHMAYDHEMINEAIAGVRVHWKGLFVLGAPDGVVINVTKDAIWARAAVLPDSGNFKRPTTETEVRQMFGGQIPETMRIPEPQNTREDLLSPGVRAIEIPPSEFVPADVLRPLNLDFGKAFGPAMGKDIPVGLLFGAKGMGSAVGELTHALRSLASALNLLGGGIVGQALPDSPHKDQVKQTFGAVADMVKQATRQSDHIREAGSAAVMGAAKSMQDQDKRGDLKAAAAALVDVVTTVTGELQKPEVRDQAKQTASLMIDGLAAQLGSPAVQDGSADPTAILKAALASSQALTAGLFGQVLHDPGTAQQGQQAFAVLGRFGSSAMAGHDGTPALADALRSIGRMLQDPKKLDAVKSAASALIEAAASVGGRLQQPDTRSAVKGGAGLLIDGVGRQMAGLSGKAGGEPAAREDLPAPTGT
jgi:ribonuclease Z